MDMKEENVTGVDEKGQSEVTGMREYVVDSLKITVMSILIPCCGGDRGKPPFLHQPLLL